MKIKKTVKKYFFTGDCHAQFSRFNHFITVAPNDETTAVIILGDAGFNYNLNQNDYWRKKAFVKKFKFIVYCLKGNHEARPETIENIKLVYDENVGGYVYVEEEFPTIRYFTMYGEYTIDNKKVLAIGGAYSVDKPYRLIMNYQWFADEQMTQCEMDAVSNLVINKHYDIIMTHTCPYSYRPIDLFLNGIDQNKVDNTMEKWLEKLKSSCKWNNWFFGHYHADRIERPYVDQFYLEIESLDTIMERWERYEKTGELDWWLPLAKDFYVGCRK